MPPATWKCVVCARAMDASLRKQHSGGKPHQRALARTYALSTWRCDACHRTMCGDRIAGHLRTKDHLELATDRSSGGAMTIPKPRRTAPKKGELIIYLAFHYHSPYAAATSPRRPADMLLPRPISAFPHQPPIKKPATAHPSAGDAALPWRCHVCCRTMGLKDRVSHLAGAPHSRAVAAVIRILRQTSEHTTKLLTRPNMTSTGRMLATRELETWADCVAVIHEQRPKEVWTDPIAALRESRPRETWTCSDCGISTAKPNKAAHLAGNHHRETLVKTLSWRGDGPVRGPLDSEDLSRRGRRQGIGAKRFGMRDRSPGDEFDYVG